MHSQLDTDYIFKDDLTPQQLELLKRIQTIIVNSGKVDEYCNYIIGSRRNKPKHSCISLKAIDVNTKNEDLNLELLKKTHGCCEPCRKGINAASTKVRKRLRCLAVQKVGNQCNKINVYCRSGGRRKQITLLGYQRWVTLSGTGFSGSVSWFDDRQLHEFWL